MHAAFELMCPNCGGPNTDDRLILGLPCPKCLPDVEPLLKARASVTDPLEFKLLVLEALKRQGTHKMYEAEVVALERELRKVSEFFKRALGNEPWSAQRTWIKRVLEGKSFSILAPTGVGKTAFGMIMSLYLAAQGKRCYIVLPTTVLVKQVSERMEEYRERLGLKSVRVLAYRGSMSASEKREFQERLSSGDFDVLVTTSQYLARNFDLLSGFKFDFIFVDDVDALLKSSRNIDRVLMLLGFTRDMVDDALQLVYLKRRMAAYVASRRRLPEDLLEEYNELVDRISKRLREGSFGTLVVSTATGRVRGLRSKVFRELLGFEVGSRPELLRNVYDTYVIPEGEGRLMEEVLRLVRELGSGGLVFVPVDYGVEYAKKLADFLTSHGIRCKAVHADEKEPVDEFARGDLDVLVGVAIYYGLLVRGLDLPERIRYAVFAGVPRFKFSMRVDDASPIRLLSIASSIREYLPEPEADELGRHIVRLRRLLATSSQRTLAELAEVMRGERELTGESSHLAAILEVVRDLRRSLQRLLSDKAVIESLMASKYLSLREEDGELYLYVPDTMTYLQASGRTSRMYAGGVSRGLSVVIVDDEKLLNGLMRQSRWYSEDIEWRRLDELDLREVLEEINRDRSVIRALREGRAAAVVKEPIKSALLVVESPNKARTISNFYGRPSRKRIGDLVVYEVSTGDYILSIIASGGHVFDLVTRSGFHGIERLNGTFVPVYTTIKRCAKCGAQFTDQDSCPVCKSSEFVDSLRVVRALRELAREVDVVLIGTDPDTEGEKIGWDLAVALAPYAPEVRRIEFHEITKRAITQALRNLRDINMRLVEAQIVRRVEDRWIGFVLSQKLWSVFGSRWLSAGRVQTPVLAWIVERYREHVKSKRYVFRVLLSNGYVLTISDLDVRDRKSAEELADKLLKSHLEVLEVKDEPVEVQPPPPFSTDSMLREAARILRVGVDEVMRLAQDLFELGLITYHRTDSVRVSAVGRALASEYIRERFTEEDFVPREWSKEGAHECIRPTRPIDAERLRELVREGIIVLARPLTRRHYVLYDLIFRRFIASQMRSATLLRRTVRLRLGDYETTVQGYVRVLEEGFTRVYLPFEIMREYDWSRVEVKDVSYRKTPTVPLYTQADIIRLMKDKGIGRPSTYAKIVKTLLDRRYVVETRGRKLVPTRRGIEVLEYLLENYSDLVSEGRTRLVERLMDQIERGEVNYQDVLREFYEEIAPIAEGG